MPSHKATAMFLNIAAVVLCCTARVSAFTNLQRVVVSSRSSCLGQTRVPRGAGPAPGQRGYRSSHRLSMKLDEGRSAFDPLGFSSGERRRRGEKGALQAIKIGMGNPRHEQEVLQDQVPSSPAVATGWDYWKYRLLLLGVALLWGTNFPAVKFVEQHGEVSDATAAFVRFAIAAGASLPFADFREKEVLLAGMEIGGWVALGYLTQAVGLQTSDASVCAFLCSLTVVVVPLLDAVTGKGIKRVTVAASLLALLGTGFLELGDAHASWNDMWCVAQAIGFGVAFTRIEHYMEKFPGKSLQLSIGQLISVAGLTGIWCAYSAGGHFPDFSFIKDPPIAAALAYTGLVTTSLAVWLETVCLEQVPAAEMSVIFSTEPLWATLVSVVFLKETMGPNALVGAGTILLACLVAQSEQIVELLGMGAKKDNQLLDQSQSDTDDGVHETPSVAGERDSFPFSVLDEMEPMVEESFDVSTVQEYTLPAGVNVEGSPFDEREANDVPAVRVGWFGAVASE